MLPVERSSNADEDIDDILQYLQERSPTAAVRFADELERRCELLGKFPEMGRMRDDLQPGVRTVAVGKYIIIYRVTESAVGIARVLHGARDIESIMRDE